MTDTCSFKRDLLMIKLSYILPQFLWPTLIKLPLSSAWSKLLEVSNVVPKYFDQGILVICLLLNLKGFQMLQETRETIFDIWHWQQRNEVKMWSSQLLSQFKQLQIKLKKDFRALNPWPLGLCCSSLLPELWRTIHWEQTSLLSSS